MSDQWGPSPGAWPFTGSRSATPEVAFSQDPEGSWAFLAQKAADWWRMGRMAGAGRIVQERLANITGYTDEAKLQANTFLENLSETLGTLEMPPDADLGIVPLELSPITVGNRPGLGELNLPTNWPTKDFSVSLLPVAPLEEVDFPLFNITAPTYETVLKPTLDTIGDLETPPVITDIDIPGLPTVTLPDVPTLESIVLPSPPDIGLPDFDESLVSWNVDDPGQFTWGEPVYHSDIWADLIGKILDGLRNGGTGLDVQVEEDIYWQHLNRTFQENDDLIRQAENYWSARGFTLPPGMLSAKINEINAQISRNNLQASKDITISQAELAQKNTHFIMEKGTQLEGMMREFFISQANMSLSGQRSVAEHSIALYNAQVQKFNYYLEEYKTKAGVWESRVRSALVQVEIFKAQVESARVSADVQKLLVDVYSAQVDAAQKLIQLYVAQMQGAQIASEVQKTRMQIYSEQVKAYLARIEVNKARLMQYEAELGGEKTKADIYSSQVSAYGVHVDAKSKELQGKIARMNGDLEYNKALIEEYKADIGAYSAEVTAKGQEISAKVDGFKALASAYEAETSMEEANIRAQIAMLQARVQEAEFKLKQSVAQVEAATQGYLGLANMKVTGQTGMANIGAQLVSAALNAVNIGANIGYSGSDSDSSSASINQHTSIST